LELSCFYQVGYLGFLGGHLPEGVLELFVELVGLVLGLGLLLFEVFLFFL
jgi:hypothetical protein